MPTPASAGKPESSTAGRSTPMPDSISQLKPSYGFRKFKNTIASCAVAMGGIGIIASILAIFGVIGFETIPLFQDPRISPITATPVAAPKDTLLSLMDEYGEIVCFVHCTGFTFIDLKTGKPVTPIGDAPALNGARITHASAPDEGTLVLALSDGRILSASLTFETTFPDGIDGPRIQRPTLRNESLAKVPKGQSIRALGHTKTVDGTVFIFALDGNEGKELLKISGGEAEEDEDDFGSEDEEDSAVEVTRIKIDLPSPINALALSESAHYVFAGLQSGETVAIKLDAPSQTKESQPAFITGKQLESGSAPITHTSVLLGGRTLVTGDAKGRLKSWQLVRAQDNSMKLIALHTFDPHNGPIRAILPSARNKGFITASSDGLLGLHYATTGETLLKTPIGRSNISGLAITEKDDRLLTFASEQAVRQWTIHNPHPEITFSSLFGKIWYEGYTEPDHVWQSTGGTDEFEPKLSLTPLLWGTLKGTFYALLFAIPLGLFGALYASQFMDPKLRDWVKPIIEIMAALPSVVLGFLAGIWLAPKLAEVAPGFFMMLLLVPISLMSAAIGYEYAPSKIRNLISSGRELPLLFLVVLGASAMGLFAGEFCNTELLSGDYRNWLLENFNVKYDPRNSMVVGIAMGIAVIPIIFTIAEDALSNVPAHLKAGALALGATEWQAAIRVILPTASPGIFSAIMIGFGRAVGETMIVLMATGNTPIMDLSMFTGFRALSANIAVELPEAAQATTHFRILFLAALLLAAMTFIVNSIAEIVRLRLRKKYSLI